MIEVKRTSSGGYAQTWPAYDAAQVEEKRIFQTLLQELCRCIEEPEQITGRPRLSLGDMIFCMVFKVYSTFSARRFMTDLREAQAKGLIGKVPHFNSLSHYLRMEPLALILTRLIEISSLPLETFEQDFAVDSTGFSTSRYARWVDERTNEGRTKREWVKVHLICGVRTNVVASVIVTSSRAADCPYFGRLINAAARNFEVAEVSADKGYFAAENMRKALSAGAVPFIPFKSNSNPDSQVKSTLWKRMFHLYRYRQAEFRKHYNKRNNVETTFSMIKAKFGDRLRSKGQQAQFNEALCKVLCHNLCVIIQSMYEFKVVPEFSSNTVLSVADSKVMDSIGVGRIVAGATPLPDRWEGEKQSGKQRKRRRSQVNLNQLSLFEVARES